MFGGAPGLKSVALLESAAAAPRQLLHYRGTSDLLRIATHLANAIVRNHPFVDGNKRTATVAMLEFLLLNGSEVDLPDTAERQPLADLMEQLASGQIGSEELAAALRPALQER